MSNEILGSTEYVDVRSQSEPWYQLEVINKWDFAKKSICSKRLFGVNINYCLKLNTPTQGDAYKSVIVEELNEEMKTNLRLNKYKINE